MKSSVKSSAKKDEEIEALWSKHMTTAFPSICRGEDINGIDLVILDADIAGCVSTFLSGHHGRLDHERIGILRRCKKELATVLPKLPTAGREYYLRLQRMADLVMGKVK